MRVRTADNFDATIMIVVLPEPKRVHSMQFRDVARRPHSVLGSFFTTVLIVGNKLRALTSGWIHVRINRRKVRCPLSGQVT